MKLVSGWLQWDDNPVVFVLDHMDARPLKDIQTLVCIPSLSPGAPDDFYLTI